jgi:undecaprenyl-diphosphatase
MIRNLFELDARLTARLSLADRPGLLRRLAAFFAHSADSWFWLAGLALLWLLGNDAWKALALRFTLGIAVTAVLVFAIKLLVRRRRPDGEWGQVYRRTDPHSFPSGHAARAAMLGVLALGFGPTGLAIALLAWAPLVIAARVAMGVHYLSDVLAGAIFGIIAGVVIMQLL